MKNERAIIDLTLVVFGLGLHWLFAKIGGSEFVTLAGLYAAVCMLVAGGVCWSLYARGTINLGFIPINAFLRGSWRETIEQGARFVAICVFCLVAVPISSLMFQDWWIEMWAIALCVATFTVVRPLAQFAFALLFRKKYEGMARRF